VENSTRGLIEAAYGCAGERCMAGSTAVVIGDANKTVLPAILDAARAIKVGPTDREAQPDMGPVITRQHRERVLQLIEAGAKEGAKISVDGRGAKVSDSPNGFYLGATVLDEVQTGLHRTGPFLAAHHYGVEPDMVILAKALSGGLIPVGAVLMSDEICDAVYSSVKRAFIHTSTFSENGLAMRAGLATLDVLANEHLGLEAARKGHLLRELLEARLSKYEMFKEVRGKGLLNGIEFQAPSSLGLRLSYAAFQAVHAGLFGQMLVMRLFRNENVLSQICGNNFMVLKVAPPLTVSEKQIEEIVDAIDNVVDDIHSSTAFWTDALGLARRIVVEEAALRAGLGASYDDYARGRARLVPRIW